MAFRSQAVGATYSRILILSPLIIKLKKTRQSWTPSDKTFWIRACSKGPNQHAQLLILLKCTSVSLLSADTHSMVRLYTVQVDQWLNLCMLDIFHAFVVCWLFNYFKNKSFKNTTRVSTSLDPDQARRFVRSDLDSTVSKAISRRLVTGSKERVKHRINLVSQVLLLWNCANKSITNPMSSDCYKEGNVSLKFSNLHIACSAQTVCKS